jgi:hypothetical protein
MCKFIDAISDMSDARKFYTEMLMLETNTTQVTIPPRKAQHGTTKAQTRE